MPPQRCKPAELRAFLDGASPEAQEVLRALREMVLRVAPRAQEAVKFHVLAYFHGEAWLGSIGGNICMIEVRKGQPFLTFIRGAELGDPHRLLRGSGKFKRFLPVPDLDAVRDPRLAALVHESAIRIFPLRNPRR